MERCIALPGFWGAVALAMQVQLCLAANIHGDVAVVRVNVVPSNAELALIPFDMGIIDLVLELIRCKVDDQVGSRSVCGCLAHLLPLLLDVC